MGYTVIMNQVIPLLLFLYISDSSSLADIEDTTLHRLDVVLSTEPTIFHYPRTDSSRETVKHVIVPRDIPGIPVPSSSPRYPSYSAPSRTGFFTPPLPPEYLNPFAGKPTLRGTNSDSQPHPQRRPIPPNPPRPLYDNKDRVPLPPPDFTVPEQKPSGKKALNTPSRPNSQQAFESAFNNVVNIAKSDNPSSRGNETDFELPILQSPSVSRILSGSSGHKKHDLLDLGDRRSSNPRHPNFEEMAKNLPTLRKTPILPVIIPEPPPPRLIEVPVPKPLPPIVMNTTVINKTEPMVPIIPVVKVDEVIKRVESDTPVEVSDAEETPSTDREEDLEDVVADSELQKVADSGMWSVAWDIHVYLVASLFAVLALYALYNLAVIGFYRHLLSRAYFITIHIVIAVIGVVRAVYLFHDAYNVGRSYHDAVSRLLLNIACPLITTAFATMFLFLVKTTEVSVVRPIAHPLCLILVSLSHLALCICLDVTSDLGFEVNGRKYLPLVCQSVYILLCVVLGSCYLCLYKTLAGAASRKQMEVFGAVYTTDVRRTRPVALCLAIRICLAVAMLIILMAVVQVYGAVSVPDGPEPSTQRWLWWAYQFSVRVIEVAVCYLLAWAAMQRLHNEDEKETNSQNSTTGFALFPCGPCRTTDENIDDIYPAVCNTNQAIHNYSLRTGKKVYDDVFPLNTMEKQRGNGNLTWNNYDEIGPGSEVVEVKDALTRKGLSTLSRSDSDHSSGVPVGRLSGTLPGDRRRPRDIPSSMLVDENGFVRFRSLAADDALRRAHPGNKSLPRRPHDVR